MYSALEAAERGWFAAFDVVNAYDASAGAEGFRTIAVYPRVREVPGAMSYLGLLRSPVGPLTAVYVGSPLDDADRELWIWDPLTGSRTKLYGLRRFVLPTWSADGNWLAVTDEEPTQPSRCAVIDVRSGRAQDLTDALMQLPRSALPASRERLECAIFGWVLDEPSRVAAIVRDLGANPDDDRWIYDFFFDVGSGELIPGPSLRR